MTLGNVIFISASPAEDKTMLVWDCCIMSICIIN